VIKELLVARGPPPPPHPHLNKVYDRIIDQGTAFELRQVRVRVRVRVRVS